MPEVQSFWLWFTVGVVVIDGILIPLGVQAVLLMTARRRRTAAMVRFRVAGLTPREVAIRDERLTERQADALLRRWRRRHLVALIPVALVFVYPSLLTVVVAALVGAVFTYPLGRAAWEAEAVRAERDGLFLYQMWREAFGTSA